MMIEAESHSQVAALRADHPDATIVVVEDDRRTIYRPHMDRPIVMPKDGVPKPRISR
jgi:hypothetical protein